MKTSEEQFITVGDHKVPVIAFFGTKGGVGKTTIVDKFATIVARSESKPNVLLVDFDVHHRGLTVLRTGNRIEQCPTVHEYFLGPEVPFGGAINVTPVDYPGKRGSEYLIPASNPAAEKVFKSLGSITPDDLFRRMRTLFSQAAATHSIDLIIIDCGPIVDPLTATAAYMANWAFIIGQNEPITHSSLQNYAMQIHDFFPDFDGAKVRVILNKVRGPVSHKAGVYAVIPFTMEVVDYSEGLTNIDDIRLTYLDYSIYGILSDVFRNNSPSLIPGPEAVLSSEQRKVIEDVDRFKTTKPYLRYKKLSWSLIAGGVLIIGSGIVMRLVTQKEAVPSVGQPEPISVVIWGGLIAVGVALVIIGGIFLSKFHEINSVVKLKMRKGYKGLLDLLHTKAGRKKYDAMRRFSETLNKEDGL